MADGIVAPSDRSVVAEAPSQAGRKRRLASLFKRTYRGVFGNPKNAIFLSYRTADALCDAAWLTESLRRSFGHASVFLAPESLRHETDFPPELKRSIRRCSVVIVIVGPNWNPEQLHNTDDWVRHELECAKQYNKPVFATLVRGSAFPEETPDAPELKRLKESQFQKIRDESIRADLGNLCHRIESYGLCNHYRSQSDTLSVLTSFATALVLSFLLMDPRDSSLARSTLILLGALLLFAAAAKEATSEIRAFASVTGVGGATLVATHLAFLGPDFWELGNLYLAAFLASFTVLGRAWAKLVRWKQ
ncbi:MAG: TIR domain-containing protein [Sandaracinaceae bacterium]|nr:MAG: TIR domain-containing protein [Sandaracinaceae bacterium]